MFRVLDSVNRRATISSLLFSSIFLAQVLFIFHPFDRVMPVSLRADFLRHPIPGMSRNFSKIFIYLFFLQTPHFWLFSYFSRRTSSADVVASTAENSCTRRIGGMGGGCGSEFKVVQRDWRKFENIITNVFARSTPSCGGTIFEAIQKSKFSDTQEVVRSVRAGEGQFLKLPTPATIL